MSEVNIQIPQELFAPAESSYFSGEYPLEVLASGPDIFSFKNPLAWQVTITNTGEALLVTGTVEGEATVSCGRCLEPYDFAISGEIEGYFLFSEDDEAPEDLDDDEYDVLPKSNIIDLEPLLKAAIILEFPYIPLCDEDCKGLCPHCGVDLNNEECACAQKQEEEEVKANPFSVLKDLPLDN